MQILPQTGIAHIDVEGVLGHEQNLGYVYHVAL